MERLTPKVSKQKGIILNSSKYSFLKIRRKRNRPPFDEQRETSESLLTLKRFNI